MKQVLLTLIFGLSLITLSAQEESNTRARFDLNFAMGFPVGDYAESSHDIGFGADLGFYFPISKSAPWFQIGPQFLLMATGTNSQDIDQRIEISVGNQVIDVIDIPMRVETVNSIIGGHLLFRAEVGSSNSGFVPYLQGMVGVRRIGTDISIYDDSSHGFFDNDDDDKITSSTALEDWIFSYGGGAGFHIKLGGRTFLNIGANYLLGGKAKYYTDDDIDMFDVNFVGDGSNYNPLDPKLDGDDIEVTATPTESVTNMVQLNIGLNFILNKN